MSLWRKAKTGLLVLKLRVRLELRKLIALFSFGRLELGREISLYSPLVCNGKGHVTIGDRVSVGWPESPKAGRGEVLVQARTPEAVVTVGENVSFSNNVAIIAKERVTIGAHCLLGDFVLILDSDFHEVSPMNRRLGPGKTLPVTIGENVWFGSRVVVQKGVTIGENSIITPLSVVIKDIPPNSIAGGNPAKVIRSISDNER